jgi:hypothetical protein
MAGQVYLTAAAIGSVIGKSIKASVSELSGTDNSL